MSQEKKGIARWLEIPEADRRARIAELRKDAANTRMMGWGKIADGRDAAADALEEIAEMQALRRDFAPADLIRLFFPPVATCKECGAAIPPVVISPP